MFHFFIYLFIRLGITNTDGDFWVEQRNYALRHLKHSGYGTGLMEQHIQIELNDLLEMFSDFNEKPVRTGTFFAPSVVSVLWVFVAGKRLSRNDTQLAELLHLMRVRNNAFSMQGGWLNALPFLRFIAPEKSSYNLIKQFNRDVLNFLMPYIEEHKKCFSVDKAGDDLIYAFINEMKQANGEQTNFTEKQLIMMVLDLFIAAAQAPSFTSDFILMMLVLHSDVQKKCQQVIDEVLGDAQLSSLSDKSKLAYIDAMIIETQRFSSVATVGGPRRTMKDTILCGYLVPKDTMVLTGLQTINTDAEYWGDPEVFRPERFLDGDGNITNTERLANYARGKRRCLGEALARKFLFMFTVGILQKFNLEIPPNAKRPEVPSSHGLLRAPEPFEIVFKHR